MKKQLITLAVLPICAFATNQTYVTIVEKTNSDYVVSKSTGNIRCSSYDVIESELYKGESALQTGMNCETEYTSSTGTEWKPTVNQTQTISGTHLESSCKGILEFDSSLASKDYSVLVNSMETTVTCDMDTDNGGWTLLTEEHYTGAEIAPMVNIDDKNLNYTEILYFDLGSLSSYGNGSPNWDWEGLEVGRQAFQFDSTNFYNQSGGFVHTCNPLNHHLPSSDYRVIESSGSNCHYQSNDINTCYDKVAIKVPTGKRLTGFRDVESIYQTSNCYPDNDFDMHYKILVR